MQLVIIIVIIFVSPTPRVKGIIFSGHQSALLLSVHSLYINTHFAWHDISVLSWWILMKFGRSIHHKSGHYCKGFQFQRSRSYTEWSRRNCTKFIASPFFNRLQYNHTVFTKAFRRDHCLPVNAKFVSVKYSLNIHVMSTVTLYDNVNMTSLTVEDWQLIKTSQSGKG